MNKCKGWTTSSKQVNFRSPNIHLIFSVYLSFQSILKLNDGNVESIPILSPECNSPWFLVELWNFPLCTWYNQLTRVGWFNCCIWIDRNIGLSNVWNSNRRLVTNTHFKAVSCSDTLIDSGFVFILYEIRSWVIPLSGFNHLRIYGKAMILTRVTIKKSLDIEFFFNRFLDCNVMVDMYFVSVFHTTDLDGAISFISTFF